MDNKAFIDQMMKHITREQAAAILDDLTNPDPYLGYCVVCGEQHIVLDANGDVFRDDAPWDDYSKEPAEHREPHADNCPIALLAQELQAQA